MIKKSLCFVISLAMMFTMCAVDVFATPEEPISEEASELAIAEWTGDEGIVLTGNPGDTTIELSWTSDLKDGETPITEGDFAVYKDGEKVDYIIISLNDEVFSTILDFDPSVDVKYIVKTVDGTKESNEYVYEAPVVAPAPVTGLNGSIAGYMHVLLKWTPSEKANGYIIKRNGAVIATLENPTASEYNACAQDFSTSGVANSAYYNYKFEVVAFAKDGDTQLLSPAAAINKNPVRPMLITYKAKKKKSITRNGKAVYKLKKNQKFVSTAFQGGRVKPVIRGNRCSFPLIYCKSAKAQYTTAWNYTQPEKEKFVNDRGLSSGTAYLVWVSQYTQQVTLFTKKNGKWAQYACWETSTGKPSTPSVVGDFKVHKKMKKRHGIPYWTAFYSTMSIHTKPAGKSAKKLGTPKSGGCVRVEKANAKWAYPNLKKGTRVVIY